VPRLREAEQHQHLQRVVRREAPEVVVEVAEHQLDLVCQLADALSPRLQLLDAVVVVVPGPAAPPVPPDVGEARRDPDHGR